MRNPHLASALVLLLMAIAGGAAWWTVAGPPPPTGATSVASTTRPAAVSGSIPGPTPFVHRSTHYAVTSTATPQETAAIADATEALRSAWLAFFDLPQGTAHTPMSLRLYGTRAEFSRHNRSRPWAEAYYLRPTCHAYVVRGQPNPHHWMLHEATHQLNDLVLDVRRPLWINEGLAAYFGASRLVGGRLMAGSADVGAYPIWWLDRIAYSGDLAADVDAKRVVPLRALITGEGADINDTLNPHYVGFWSLVHFLVHHDDGVHLRGFHQLIREGGSLDGFERLIGPLPVVEAAWYGYLLEQAALVRSQRVAGGAA